MINLHFGFNLKSNIYNEIKNSSKQPNPSELLTTKQTHPNSTLFEFKEKAWVKFLHALPEKSIKMSLNMYISVGFYNKFQSTYIET